MLGIPKRALMIGLALIAVAMVYATGLAGRGMVGDHKPGCVFTVSADTLNVREKPSASARIVGSFELNATVAVEPTVRNGFRKVRDGQWVSADFLTPISGHKCG